MTPYFLLCIILDLMNGWSKKLRRSLRLLLVLLLLNASTLELLDPGLIFLLSVFQTTREYPIPDQCT